MQEITSFRGSAATIGELLQYVLPRGFENAPGWPPDTFAVAAALLHRSGAYSFVVDGWPPQNVTLADWVKLVNDVSATWRAAVAAQLSSRRDPTGGSETPVPLPAQVVQWWGQLIANRDTAVGQIRGDAALCESLLQLCAVADEASWGLGIPASEQLRRVGRDRKQEDESITRRVGREAQRLLIAEEWTAQPTQTGAINRAGSTLCKQIHPSRLRVLPKLHTPQNGLTIRSFSRNLALCVGDEINPTWHLMARGPGEESINLLIVPWPEEVLPSQFAAVAQTAAEQRLPDRHGFFTLHPTEDNAAGPDIEKIYTQAERLVGPITTVVFPELSLTPTQHEKVRSYVMGKKASLICGLFEPSREAGQPGVNCFRVDIPFREGGSFNKQQHKHHRWMIEKSQIIQYGLGSMLSPSKLWWEHIVIRDRSLMFLALRDWLTMSVLICEDLARPDPVGDIVRAVGPNLVIALLMDGPQLSTRWSARYATVLADDPGTSVLSITSLGMAKLSRPPYVQSRPRVVALWKDAKSGGPVEIDLPQGASAVVLSLTVQYMEEWTADGRSDDCSTGYPTLAGIHPVVIPVSAAAVSTPPAAVGAKAGV